MFYIRSLTLNFNIMIAALLHQKIERHVNAHDKAPDFKKWKVKLTSLTEKEVSASEKGSFFKKIDTINKDQTKDLIDLLETTGFKVEADKKVENIIVYKPE